MSIGLLHLAGVLFAVGVEGSERLHDAVDVVGRGIACLVVEVVLDCTGSTLVTSPERECWLVPVELEANALCIHGFEDASRVDGRSGVGVLLHPLQDLLHIGLGEHPPVLAVSHAATRPPRPPRRPRPAPPLRRRRTPRGCHRRPYPWARWT